MTAVAQGGGVNDFWAAGPAARDWRCPTPSGAARAFHAALPGYRPTPLVELPALAAELGVGRVLVKDESARLGLPAFKILGASWAVARVAARRAGSRDRRPTTSTRSPGNDRLTLVTATDGNHGRAVARMAGPAAASTRNVVVPRTLAAPARRAIRARARTSNGRRRLRRGGRQAAARAADRPDAALVQDVAWPGYEEVPGWIVDGYATLPLRSTSARAGRPPRPRRGARRRRLARAGRDHPLQSGPRRRRSSSWSPTRRLRAGEPAGRASRSRSPRATT